MPETKKAPEIMALEAVYDALKALAPDVRSKVLESVYALLEIKAPTQGARKPGDETDRTRDSSLAEGQSDREAGRRVGLARLRVPLREARAALDLVEHASFSAAVDSHWNVGSDGQVSAQSVCWLFCWGKTGMGSKRAAEAARRAFDEALDISFDVFDAHVPHEWARHARYELGDIEAELSRFLV